MKLEDILFSEEFLFEGEQADAYRARKAAEAKKMADEEKEEKYKQTARTGAMMGRVGPKYGNLHSKSYSSKFYRDVNNDDNMNKNLKAMHYAKERITSKDDDDITSTDIAGFNKTAKRLEKGADRILKKYKK